MSLEAGATVDAYRVLSVLGSGGMGEVFRVEHTLTKRQEAMKVLADGRLRAGEQAQRFLREIQLQASLNHPHIAAVHHAFWRDNDLVMVMELVEGKSLLSLLEVGRVSLPSALNFASQVLDALHYAHQRGVVHRDVTPANILITPEGVVKLTDFGLAKAASDMRLTQTGAVLGSLYYMSPEQVRGDPTVDAHSDVYSLGVVLYEMATGSRPFEGDNPFSLMLAHVEQPPVPPLEVDPGLPPVLNEILLTALAKEPGKRYSSAGSFRDALENLRESVVEGRPVDSARGRRWPRSRIMRYGAGVLLMCATMLVGIWRWKAPDAPIVLETGARLEQKAAEPSVRANLASTPAPPAEPRKHKPPHRRFWLWRAFGKVVHPRAESKN